MRTYDKSRYWVAALITGGIFLLGLFLGLVVEGKRIATLQEDERMQNLEFASLQIQYQFVDQLAQERNCEAVEETFNANLESLERSRVKLDEFSRDSALNAKQYDVLKREYLLSQLRYWMLAKQTKTLCKRDMIDILYFFHNTEECPDCDEQAFILDYLKKIFKDKLLIFSIDNTFTSEPMVSITRQTYNITEYPTLLIDGEKHTGLATKEDLLVILCSRYEGLEACENLAS